MLKAEKSVIATMAAFVCVLAGLFAFHSPAHAVSVKLTSTSTAEVELTTVGENDLKAYLDLWDLLPEAKTAIQTELGSRQEKPAITPNPDALSASVLGYTQTRECTVHPKSDANMVQVSVIDDFQFRSGISDIEVVYCNKDHVAIAIDEKASATDQAPLLDTDPDWIRVQVRAGGKNQTSQLALFDSGQISKGQKVTGKLRFSEGTAPSPLDDNAVRPRIWVQSSNSKAPVTIVDISLKFINTKPSTQSTWSSMQSAGVATLRKAVEYMGFYWPVSKQ